MSIKIMESVWELDIPGNEKFVLLKYADHAEDNGTNIFPAVATVASRTGYSERQVRRITRRLQAKGLLIPDGRGPHGTNRWRSAPMTEKMSPLTSAPEGMTSATARDDTGVSGGMTSATARDDTGVSGGMTPMSPEPSFNHQFNRQFNRHEPYEEEEGTKIKNVYAIFGEEIGVLTPVIADELDEACQQHSEHWLIEALKAASRNGKRNWAYAKAILTRWKAEGYGTVNRTDRAARPVASGESKGAAVARAWLARQPVEPGSEQ